MGRSKHVEAEQAKPPRTKRRSSNSIEARVESSDRAVANSAAHGAHVSGVMRRRNKLIEYLDPHTEEMADITMSIARNRKVHASIRLEAATRILDRVYGKAKESINVSTEDENSISGDEVLGLLNNILENVGAAKLEGPKNGG